MAAQYTNLRATMTVLQGVRDSLRKTIHLRVRPLLRPLNILDSPDDDKLLMRIFGYAVGHKDFVHDQPDSFQTAMHNSRKSPQLKHIRLTCRRFCDASSQIFSCKLCRSTSRSRHHSSALRQSRATPFFAKAFALSESCWTTTAWPRLRIFKHWRVVKLPI